MICHPVTGFPGTRLIVFLFPLTRTRTVCAKGETSLQRVTFDIDSDVTARFQPANTAFFQAGG